MSSAASCLVACAISVIINALHGPASRPGYQNSSQSESLPAGAAARLGTAGATARLALATCRGAGSDEADGALRCLEAAGSAAAIWPDTWNTLTTCDSVAAC